VEVDLREGVESLDVDTVRNDSGDHEGGFLVMEIGCIECI
jgi:hypothetical protein